MKHAITFGEVRIDSGIEDFLNTEIIQRLDLGILNASIKGKLRSAIRNGVVPVEPRTTGKLAMLYKAICEHFYIPQAYFSKNSKYLLIRRVSTELSAEIRAINLIAGGDTLYAYTGDDGKLVLNDYNTNLTYEAVANAIKRHAPPDMDKVQAALTAINTGHIITFTNNIGA